MLGIATTASEDDVKHQFIALGRKFKNMNGAVAEAGAAFKKVAQAYLCLSNLEKRQLYDKYLANSRDKYFTKDEDINPENILEIALHEQKSDGVNKAANKRKLLGYMQTILLLATILYMLYVKVKSRSFDSDLKAISSLDRVKPYTEALRTVGKRVKYYITKELYSASLANLDLLSDVEAHIEKKYLKRMKEQCDTVKKAKLYINHKLNQGNINARERDILIREEQSLDFTPCNIS
eukprot:TRINITY_DN4894_c0_g1_i13.p1 TRINITY_DN4894_c0_g1~~TRINITY_DN4894_c0_g1_i13.p1  ORF type:complete len:265 (-),score=36.77 TRINITY_DN4894_c0_g1_i13:122-829(-)